MKKIVFTIGIYFSFHFAVNMSPVKYMDNMFCITIVFHHINLYYFRVVIDVMVTSLTSVLCFLGTVCSGGSSCNEAACVH